MSQSPEDNPDGLDGMDRTLIAAYRGESNEVPSAAMDDRLRAAARRAVGARPRPQGRFRFGAWKVPLAAAATVVLSATVVFMTVREHGLEAWHESNPHSDVRSEPAPAPAPVPAELAKADERAPARLVSPPAARMPSSTTGADAAGVEPVSVDSQGALSAEHRRREQEPIPRPATMARSGRQVPAAEENIQRERSLPAPSASAPAPIMPGPALDDAAAESDASQAQPASAGRAAPRAQMKSSAPTAADDGRLSTTPDRQVETIRRLLREGRRAQALEQLAELRRSAPDYVLPEDLAGLVRELSPPER